jgi:hypothetical protein
MSPEARERQSAWLESVDRANLALDEHRSDQASKLLIELWNQKCVPQMPEGGMPPGSLLLTTARALQMPDMRSQIEPALRAHQSSLEAVVRMGDATPHQVWTWHDLVMLFDDVPALTGVVERAAADPKVMQSLRRPHERRRSIEQAMRAAGRTELANAMEATIAESFDEFATGPGKPLITVATSPAWFAH